MTKLIIVPAYNEAASIGSLIGRLKNEGQSDILVVNDGSNDGTEEIVRTLGIPLISLSINLGVGGAIQTGFRYALDHHYDIALQVDADGQHDPHFIDDLIHPILQDEADVVIGSRFIQKAGFQSSFYRRIGIRILQFLNYLLTGRQITDCTSGFRAYNSRAILFLSDHYSVDFPEPEAVISLLKKGFRIQEVPVVMKRREAGKTSIYGGTSMYYILKVVVSIIIEYFRRSP